MAVGVKLRWCVAQVQGSPSEPPQPPRSGGGLAGAREQVRRATEAGGAAGGMPHTPFADAPPRIGRDEEQGAGRRQTSRLLVEVRRTFL